MRSVSIPVDNERLEFAPSVGRDMGLEASGLAGVVAFDNLADRMEPRDDRGAIVRDAQVD